MDLRSDQVVLLSMYFIYLCIEHYLLFSSHKVVDNGSDEKTFINKELFQANYHMQIISYSKCPCLPDIFEVD